MGMGWREKYAGRGTSVFCCKTFLVLYDGQMLLTSDLGLLEVFKIDL